MIIPSINCQTFEEAKARIFKCRDFLPGNGWIHIDVSDGSFSPAFIWGNAEEFKTLIEARRRENEIKGWRREKKIKLINTKPTSLNA